MTAVDGRRRFLLGFGLASLGSVAIGCLVAGASGVGIGLWTRNLAAWSVGALAAAGLAARAGPRAEAAFLMAAPLGLAASLLSAGQFGVHRWIDVGPAHLNVAELLLPAALVVSVRRLHQPWFLIVTGGVLALLAVQPDTSQAAAFAAAMIVGVALASQGAVIKVAVALVAVIAVVATALRSDPLARVPEVEGIVGLAQAISPIAAALAIAALAATALSPILKAWPRSDRPASWSLATYFAVSALAPAFGAFPVPLVGMGMSPVIGFWLGAGLLAAAGAANGDAAIEMRA